MFRTFETVCLSGKIVVFNFYTLVDVFVFQFSKLHLSNQKKSVLNRPQINNIHKCARQYHKPFCYCIGHCSEYFDLGLHNIILWTFSTVLTIFTRDSVAIARICYGNSVCPSVCLSVCPSVCLSHGWISQKRLKLGSRSFHHTVAPSL